MKQMMNSGNNNINFFPQDDNLLINKQPENFFEDEEAFLNIQNLEQNINVNQNINLNSSFNLPNNNKKCHDSSIKTNATFGEISQEKKDNFSFFSFNNPNQNINIFEKKKELTKESIEILTNFINKENLITSNINININENNNINGCKVNIVNNLYIKDIKNFVFNMENKLPIYFKKPYMRKNIKAKKSLIKKKFEEDKDEDEKINLDEKNSKMEDIKDDDSKTNNDSFEEINTAFDKKKFQ